MPITTVASLRTHLQWALELEHSTIPPYLCALYSIPDGMVPYYARIMVANRGPAPASFTGGSPWWLHVAGDTLVPASAAPPRFAKCRGLRVPEPLAAGRTVKGCLLFFVPRGTAVESVDFQPGDVTTAVRWTP